jgi:glycine dehydrogenase subunit 2
MMYEPTESETKETLDDFIRVVDEILEKAEKDPDCMKNAPYTTPVRRLNELKANKDLDVRYRKS